MKIQSRQKVANLFMQATIRKDTELLSFSDKINRLERLTKLNQRTKVNSVHLSLNFDLTDDLKTEKLKTIADVYMSKIGFGAAVSCVPTYRCGASAHSHKLRTSQMKASAYRCIILPEINL